MLLIVKLFKSVVCEYHQCLFFKLCEGELFHFDFVFKVIALLEVDLFLFVVELVYQCFFLLTEKGLELSFELFF
jgi:hypothetical protein